MTRTSLLLVATSIIATMAFTAGRADDAASPIYGVKIPDGYRQWEMVTVTHVVFAGVSDDIKGILGNPPAVKALREGTLPLPDGAVLAKLTYQHVPMGGFEGVVNMAGAPVRLEFMVKDSQKYAATGGWGFGRFVDGKPADEADHRTCFECHEKFAKAHDFVFNRYAP
jgi:Cytochrome P460